MQPLAIQQLQSPLDAGDAGSAGTPHSNTNSGVVFNDLMSAARTAANEVRATEDANAARRSLDEAQAAQKDKDAERALDALAAAADFASRNVKIRQRVAAEERGRAAAADTAAAHQISTQDTEATSDNPVDVGAPTPAKNTTPANTTADPAPNTQAVSAPDNTNIKSDDQSIHRESTGDDENLTAGAKPPQDPSSPSTTTAEIAADEPSKTTHNIAATPQEVVHDDKAEEHQNEEPTSTPQAVISDESSHATDLVDGQRSDDVEQANTQKATVAPANQIPRTKTGAVGEKPKAKSQTDHESPLDLELPIIDDEDETNSSTTQLQAPERPDLQAGINAPYTGFMEPTATKASNAPLNGADPVLSGTREQKLLEPSYKNPQSEVDQSSTQLAARADAATPQVTEKTPKTVTSQIFEMRGANKFEADDATSSEQTTTATQADMNQPETANEGRGSPHQQFTDQGLTPSLKAKIDVQSKSNALPNSLRADGVDIAELTKLGVKEATLDSAPTATITEPTLDLLPLTPNPTGALQTQTQTATFTSANAGANTERRTIAADIRLRALERMVVAAARAGTDTITLQLYPPALGQVMIRLVMDGQRLRIMTRAANADAVNTLKDMEGDIRDALANHGLDLSDFDVTDDRHDKSQAQREKSAAPATLTNNGGKTETFTVDLNA